MKRTLLLLALIQGLLPAHAARGDVITPDTKTIYTIDGKTIAVSTNLSDLLHITTSEDYTGYRLMYSNEALSLIIPEPTTVTLSLLALASLATRRRRK